MVIQLTPDIILNKAVRLFKIAITETEGSISIPGQVE